ncbi:MAG: hypothetical protein KKD39_01790 [Candidatus Altiarchaeota archaeon]|nr:hypothetical protein [Candidatus Altiarchaeota archaeon]
MSSMQSDGRDRQFTSFQELATYFQTQLQKPLASLEQDHLKPLPVQGDDVADKVRDSLGHAREFLGQGRFKDADDQAWSILRLVNMGRKEDILAHSPSELAQAVRPDCREYVGGALALIGTSYRNRQRHFDAVSFLERSIYLDPKNTFALRNLSDLCVLVKPRDLEGVEKVGEEISREVDLGIATTQKLLRLLGISKGHIEGRHGLATEQTEGEMGVNICWALNNQASLLYRRARDKMHRLGNDASARQTFKDSIQHSETTLSVVGLPRKLDKVSQRLGINPTLTGENAERASRALVTIGLCNYHMGDETTAKKAYELALVIKPDSKVARDNLERIRN